MNRWRYWNHFLRRFIALPADDRRLLVEAGVALLGAKLLLQVLPFKYVLATVRQGVTGIPASREQCEQDCARIAWAIDVCVRHLPIRLVCFPQGLAAQWLLRRRKVPSAFYYGARPDRVKGLVAHVWVSYGGRAVIGANEAQNMGVLHRLPIV